MLQVLRSLETCKPWKDQRIMDVESDLESWIWKDQRIRSHGKPGNLCKSKNLVGQGALQILIAFIPLLREICQIISLVYHKLRGKCAKSPGFFENLVLKTWRNQGTLLTNVLRTLMLKETG